MENGDKLNMSNSCEATVLSKKGTFEEDEADKKGSFTNADTCGDGMLAIKENKMTLLYMIML